MASYQLNSKFTESKIENNASIKYLKITLYQNYAIEIREKREKKLFNKYLWFY